MLPPSITSICVTLEHILHSTNSLHQPMIYKETQVPPIILICGQMLQLNEYETAPNSIQLSQNLTLNCLLT
jgi:hypothetical protein